MPKGILFWVIMILWFFYGLWWDREEFKTRGLGAFGGSLLLFVLLFLLGWGLYGFVVQ